MKTRASFCLAFMLVLSLLLCSAQGQASTSSAGISARLTSTSFANAAASSVKLTYKFSKASKSFSYLLTVKKGSKWQLVKIVKKKGIFKGSKSMTIKKLFTGRTIKVGSYRVKLSADKGSKLLSFKVIKGFKPANVALPAISGIAIQGKTLTALKGSWTGSWTNSPTSYAYQWRRCDGFGSSCASILGATHRTYILALVDVGRTICVVVTAKNAYGSAAVTAAQTDAVASAAPTNISLPAISGIALQGQTLTASNGSWTSLPTSYAYQWRQCDSFGGSCASIPGATNRTYLLALADVGRTICVAVTASNAYGSAAANFCMTDAVVSAAPANLSLPTISGIAIQGQTLTASNGSWTNSPTSYTYQWRRCDGFGSFCTSILGATDKTYVLVGDDADCTIRVVVTANNDYGSVPATSDPQTDVVPEI